MMENLPFQDGEQRVVTYQEALPHAPQPVVTYALIAVNALIFLAMLFTQASLVSPTAREVVMWGGNFGPLTLGGQWWRLITACFLHFGFIHIAMNMFILFQVGILTEKLFGNARYLLLYLLAGIGGNIAGLFSHPLTVSAGASGAVFGVYGGLLGFLLVQRGVVPSSGAWSIAKSAFIFIAYNMIYGLRSPGTDIEAHIGGLITGFVVGCLLARPLSVDGQMLYPMRTLSVAILGAVGTYAGLAAIPKGAASGNEWRRQIVAGTSVSIGKDDRVIYSGSATKADADSLAHALLKAKYFGNPGAVVLLSKGTDGAVITIPTNQEDPTKPHDGMPGIPQVSKRLVPFPWDDPAYLAGVETTGVMIAPSVGGPPIKIAILNSNGDVEKVIPVDARLLNVGTNDDVWYSGTATAEDAAALGKALQKATFFEDKGRRVYLSKSADGSDISFMVKEGVWNDHETLATFGAIGRRLAKSLGWSPLRIHLIDKNMVSRTEFPIQ